MEFDDKSTFAQIHRNEGKHMNLNFKITAKFWTLAICMGIAGIIQHCANADALWAEIDGNEVHVVLSNKPGEAGIESDKIQQSIVTADGQDLKLNQQNDKSYLTATLPPSTNLVGASNEWGVIQSNEPGGDEYHLRYYAKAARTLKDAANPVQQNVQWYARYDEGQPRLNISRIVTVPVLARLVKDGRPVANAQVKIYNNFRNSSYPQMKVTDASGAIKFYLNLDEKDPCEIQAYWTDPIGKNVEAYATKEFRSQRYSASLTFFIDKEYIQQRLSKTWVDDTDEEISKLYVSYVSDMSISPDSKRMITYGAITRDGEPVGNRRWNGWNKRLQVWDVKTGKEIWHQSALPFSAWRVFVKPDFKTMYVSNGGFDVIDIHSLRVIKHLNIPNSSIRLSPDKKIFAVGGANNVQFMDAKLQEIIRTYWHAGYGTRVFWGPDSKTILMRAGWGKPQAVDVATAKQIHYPRWFYRVRDSDAFAFSSGGNYLAKADGQRIEIWETPTEKDAGKMLNAFVTSIDIVRVLQFSPDGKTLAVGGSSKSEVPVQFIKLSEVRK